MACGSDPDRTLRKFPAAQPIHFTALIPQRRWAEDRYVELSRRLLDPATVTAPWPSEKDVPSPKVTGTLAVGADVYVRRAVSKAAFEPDRPETMYMLTTITWKSPPRKWPTQACTSRTSRRLIPPWFMITPAKMKNGRARSTKLPTPLEVMWASATIGTDNYWSDSHTDGNGNFSIQVANGQWWVGVDCGGLGDGYLCPDEVSVVIVGTSVVTNFTVQPCGQLQIGTTSLPGGQAGSHYDFYLQASSCYASFYWALFSPLSSLPPGLQFDSSGELYGTPTTNGTFNFTVQVTDGNNVTATQPLSLTIAPAVPDALEYYVMKLECLRQLDPTNLVPDTNTGPFMAKSAVVQSGLGTVPIATLTLPGGGARVFPSGSTGIELGIPETYPSQAALDAVYANGNYTFTLATLNSGFHYPVLTMPAAGYPAPTRVSNFASAQAINPSGPFTLQWSNPADATTNDVIFVWITDAGGNVVFATPYPPTNYSTCLRGTATSTIVPANTVQPGGTYTGVIGFYRTTSVNTTAYPGAVGVTLVGVHTAFSIAAPSALPVLSQPTRISATEFGFLLSGAAGTNYTVLASTNAALPLASWSTVLITNIPANSTFIQDNQATTQRRYYRVKVGP